MFCKVGEQSLAQKKEVGGFLFLPFLKIAKTRTQLLAAVEPLSLVKLQ